MKANKFNSFLFISFLLIIQTSCKNGKNECCLTNYDRTQVITNSDSALLLLTQGNKRFVVDSVLPDNLTNKKLIDLKQNGQKPFAVIVTCSDSRVSPEIIFDQGLGDLFVIRVAGNVVDSIELGSIEYAVEHLKVPLVIVMGHEKCGAVSAAVSGGEIPGNIKAICSRIEPSINAVKISKGQNENIIDMVIDENINSSVNIINKDELLKEIIQEGKVKILGAKYLLESGKVEFFK